MFKPMEDCTSSVCMRLYFFVAAQITHVAQPIRIVYWPGNFGSLGSDKVIQPEGMKCINSRHCSYCHIVSLSLFIVYFLFLTMRKINK